MVNSEELFTRKQAYQLVGMTGGQLDHLSRLKVIIPMKVGNPKKPNVLYTWKQIIELKIISKLKERNVPNDIACSLVEHIREHNHDYSLCKKYLIKLPKLEIRKQINYLAREAGIKIKKYSNPEKYALKIENEEADYTVYLIATKEELDKWIEELKNTPGYNQLDFLTPIGEVYTELKKAASEHNINIRQVEKFFNAA